MLTQEEKVVLSQLNFHPYFDDEGQIDLGLEGKIAVYAIFDRSQQIQYIGYSRNLSKSLLQHLVRQVDCCYWYKYYLIDRPSRSILEQIKNDWLEENSDFTLDEQQLKAWTEAIDISQQMNEIQQQEYQQADELGKGKILKQIARHHEAEIKQQLHDRGVTINIRFNPKLKEQGLLDLK